MSDPISNRYDAPELEPYVKAIGQLALAWNDLLESLAALFSLLLGPLPNPGEFAEETSALAWAAIKSDRSQRDMLKAVAGNPPYYEWKKALPNIGEDIEWIVDRAGELEISRNDAIHSPLMPNSGLLGALMAYPSTEAARPYSMYFNPRAMSLKKKENILSEFFYCKDRSIVLSEYAQAIFYCMINRGRPWPERPTLPSRSNRSNQLPK